MTVHLSDGTWCFFVSTNGPDTNKEGDVRYCELMFDISNDFIIILLLLIGKIHTTISLV